MLAIGVTVLWPISFGYILWHLIVFRPEIHLPKSVLALSVLVGSTALYSPNSGSALAYAAGIIFCWIGYQIAPARKGLDTSILVVTIVSVGFVLHDLYLGHMRPNGLMDNAVEMGLAGAALLPYGAVLTGFSMSRLALGMTVMIAALLPSKRTVSACFVALFIAGLMSFSVAPERFTLNSILTASHLRYSTIIGTSYERPISSIPDVPVQDRQLQLLGYGHSGYYQSTGSIQPHNTFVLTVWELGILSIPFWILIGYIWCSHGRNVPLALIMLATSLLTSQWVSSTQGLVIITLLISTTKHIAPVWEFLSLERSYPIPVDKSTGRC